ncbi:MAG: hypothetical protein NTV99_10420 [Deltaproteobacteria bacterium]|nr:hypothetical protein [Deltaproteobacteria bacterium]
MLVDGGGSFDGRFDFGRHVIAPFLWKMRIKKIDTVVLSHPTRKSSKDSSAPAPKSIAPICRVP